MNHHEHHRSARRTVAIWTAYALVSLLALATLAYGVFWLPYRHPEDEVQPLVAVLPEQPVFENQAALLTELTWVDRDARTVRIPIEMAMRLVQDTLPIRANAAQAMQAIERDDIATDAGSGRSTTNNPRAAQRQGDSQPSAP